MYSFANPSIPVDVTHVEALPSQSLQNQLSFIDLYLQAGPIVQFVMISLLLMSVMSWAVIIDRMLIFTKQKWAMKALQKRALNRSCIMALFNYFIQERGKPNVLAHMLISSVQAAISYKKEHASVQPFDENERELVWSAIKFSSNRSLEDLKSGISFLAIAANSSPFIGLFGTVWGIMTSFQAIAVNKSATLAIVAPGIAEALMATACGLLVAIPASIFYNKFTNDIARFTYGMENFALNLTNAISKGIDVEK